MIDYNLVNPIVVWYHKQDEPSWDADSYIQVYRIESLMDYIRFRNSFSDLPQFLNGYYFFMKEGVLPTWEDPQNINGGCGNIKVAKDQIEKYLWNMVKLLMLDSVYNVDNDIVTGISVVPKKYNAVVKIWNGDNQHTERSVLNPNILVQKDEDYFYRSHTDNNTFKAAHGLE